MERRDSMRGFLVGLLTCFLVLAASGAQAFLPEARITLTFDDGRLNGAPIAQPIMSKYGFRGVSYIITSAINNKEGWVMSWDQVRTLQNLYGWEIGSHTRSHPFLTKATDQQLEEELAGSKKDLEAQGLRVKSLASPYGDYDSRVISFAAKHYESFRTAWPSAPNIWPWNDYQIWVKEVTNLTPVAEIKSMVDQAISQKQWLVLLFHALVESQQPTESQYSVAGFKEIVAYLSGKAIKVVTVSEALQYSSAPNLVRNPSFFWLDAKGWAFDWGGSFGVSIDRNRHGCAPEPVNSLKIIGGTEAEGIWSEFIPVISSKEYVIKMFQSAQDLTEGGWALWIDEFDRYGNYISGQWLGGNYDNFIGSRYYSYRPTSSSVKFCSLVPYTEEGSRLTLFIDSIELKEVMNVQNSRRRWR